jgi:hypothetical protein
MPCHLSPPPKKQYIYIYIYTYFPSCDTPILPAYTALFLYSALFWKYFSFTLAVLFFSFFFFLIRLPVSVPPSLASADVFPGVGERGIPIYTHTYGEISSTVHFIVDRFQEWFSVECLYSYPVDCSGKNIYFGFYVMPELFIEQSLLDSSTLRWPTAQYLNKNKTKLELFQILFSSFNNISMSYVTDSEETMA